MNTLLYEVVEGVPLKIALRGSIDEHSDIRSLFDRVDRDARISMRDVVRLNSIGIRNWIRHVDPVSRKHRLVIEAIPFPVVNQANCLANLFGAADVHSCMAPYYCGKCAKNLLLEVTREEVRTTRGTAPARSCSDCGAAVEFDDLDSYFAFFGKAA